MRYVPYQCQLSINHMPCQPHRPNQVSDLKDNRPAEIVVIVNFECCFDHQSRRSFGSLNQRQHWNVQCQLEKFFDHIRLQYN